MASTLLVATACVVVPDGARADPLQALTLHWEGPAGCDSGERARGEALRLLPAQGSYTAVTVRVRVRLEEDRYRVELTSDDGERRSERVLEAVSCDEVQRTVGLLIALLVDPMAAMQASAAEPATAEPASPTQETASREDPAQIETLPAGESEGSPSPEPRAAPVVPEQPPPAPVKSEDSAVSDFGLHVTLGVPLDAGALPSVATGAAAALGLGLGDLSLALGAGYLDSIGSGRVPGQTSAEVDAQLVVATLQSCLRALRWPAAALWVCIEGELGRFAAAADGFAAAASDATLWAAAQLAARGEVELGAGWAVQLGAGMLWPLRRPTLHITGVGIVHTVPPLGLRLYLGLRWQLFD